MRTFRKTSRAAARTRACADRAVRRERIVRFDQAYRPIRPGERVAELREAACGGSEM
jgi:hypothetical protein